ncbi:hypothetical protein LCGC14_2345360, partial [marine sediment metagenome]
EIIRPLFGFERWSDSADRWIRLYRRGWIEVPKKNGKSPIGAGLALQGLHADGEKTPEVYGIAAGKRQAGIVFNSAAKMVELEPALARRSEVFKSKLAHHGVIHVPRTDGYYRVIPGDAEFDDGISPSRVVIDEVHRIRNREILDLMDESLAGREEPMIIYLTTAGVQDETTIAYELHQHAVAVADHRVVDPFFFSFIRGASVEETEGDGWRNEDLWRRVNPSIESFNPSMLDDLRAAAIAAEISPVKIAGFKRLRLNVWLPPSVAARNGLVDLHAWDLTAGMVNHAKLPKRTVWAGLDMASSEDLAALVGVFPNLGGCRNKFCAADLCYDVLGRFWIPAANLEGGSTTLPKYLLPTLRGWVADGFLTVVDGDVIDDRDVKGGIDRWRKLYELEELAKDPYQTKQIGIELDEEGLVVYDHGQSMERMAGPTERFIHHVRGKRLHHGGNPVLRWMIGNAIARLDTNGNKKPDRKASSGKIDGVVALIMALAAAERGEEAEDVFSFTVGGSTA